MPIKFKDGCLLDAFDAGEVTGIAHVVNCQGVMGSGIAKSIKGRYPKVFEEYKHICSYRPQDRLGYTQTVYVDSVVKSNKIVFNLFAQLNYGVDKRHLNYGALAKSLQQMESNIWSNERIGIPYKMGSDRAGGDWEIVLELVEFFLGHHDITVYKLEK